MMPGGAGEDRWWTTLLVRAKHGLRWAVVATAGSPLCYFYRAVYRLHAWYGVRVARKFPGTRSIYLTRSMATGDITAGISDIDMTVLGDWGEEEQIRLMKAMGMLAAISPLYDSVLWQQVHRVEQLRHLWETDYFFQSRFDEGRREWKLVYGQDLTAGLPPIPPERLGGVYYMELRVWWLHFIMSVFGSGPTARDRIFRNSIAYKVVAEMGRITRAVETGVLPESRQSWLRMALDEEAVGKRRDFLLRLEQSVNSRHLRFEGDIQEEAYRYLITSIDGMHARLRGMPSFAATGEVLIDAAPDELLRSPADLDHVRGLTDHVKKQWTGYRASFFVPSIAFFALDERMLLIEVDPEDLPSVQQLRELCRMHEAGGAALRQRISPYLLLPNGACEIQMLVVAETWRLLVFPPSTPDVFALIRDPEFRIGGQSALTFSTPQWSRFASDCIAQELDVRRSILSKVTPDVFPSSLEIVRNVYRQLQLEVLLASSAKGTAICALSPAAIERHLPCTGISGGDLLTSLREAYSNEMRGATSDVRPLIPRIIDLLKSFS
jgi:predicted nucleotidyltransferase